MWIEHPELGNVPTYGGPFDSYTIPTKDSNGEFNCERYDHDVGDWVDGEYVGAQIVSDEEEIATDSILRAAEARGVDSGIDTLMSHLNHQHPAVEQAINILRIHANRLREGKA